MNYDQLKSKFERARDPSKGAYLAAHTVVVKVDDSFAVRYHETNVITVAPDNTITLNSGGWRSVTTKERINEFAENVRLWQSSSVWYLSAGKNTAIYADGVTIAPDGFITGGLDLKDALAEKVLTKKIKAYAKQYVTKLYAGEIPTPSNGDCWACLMKIPRSDHVQQHINEGYFVPSLALRAMESFGASFAMKHNVSYYLKLEGWEQTRPFEGDFLKQQIEKAIKRFCLKESNIVY